jgi:HAD superfamily hydrolase (TIGR01509 family)
MRLPASLPVFALIALLGAPQLGDAAPKVKAVQPAKAKLAAKVKKSRSVAAKARLPKAKAPTKRRGVSSALKRQTRRTQAPRTARAKARPASKKSFGPPLRFRSRTGMRKVKLVIFDLDGTLVDSRKDIATNFDAGLRAVGVKLSRHKLLMLVDGSPLEKTFKMAVPNGTEKQLKTFLRAFKASQKSRGPNVETYPGVRSMLRKLSKQPGIQLAVATARPKHNADRILKSLGLTHYFQDVMGTDESHLKHKPAPDILFHVANNLRVAPKNSIYVGDTHTDIGAANNAGMGSVALTYGMGKPAELRAQRPDHMANDVRQVLSLLGLKKPANSNAVGSKTARAR